MLDTDFPFTLAIPQARTEELLEDWPDGSSPSQSEFRLARLAGRDRWPRRTRLTG
jgi:hypothetical protein